VTNLSFLEANARCLWDRDPVVRHTFSDFGEFLQQFIVAGHGTNTAAALDSWHREQSVYAAEARARASLGRYPATAGSRPAVVERRKARLILWLVGPVTPFRDIAPAITRTVICDALEQHSDASIVVLRIDSPGGSASDAQYISNAIASHPARKIAIVDHNCYSAANYFVAAADKVLVRANARMMLHRTSAPIDGNADELRTLAHELDRQDKIFCRMFAERRRGVRPSDVARLLPLERYLSADEAIRLGFADQIIPALPPLAIPPADSSNVESDAA
jgi:ATP-dependent protease ClpP protease subunit